MQRFIEDPIMQLIFRDQQGFVVHKWVYNTAEMFMHCVCSHVLKDFCIKVCFSKVKNDSNKTD